MKLQQLIVQFLSMYQKQQSFDHELNRKLEINRLLNRTES